MERITAMYVNDKRLSKCAISIMGNLANITSGKKTGHLGIGYYSDGEILIQKRPILKELSIDELFSEIKSNFYTLAFLTDIKESFKTENTQPFRFRNWLSVISSDYSPNKRFFSKIMEHIPEYINKNIRSKRWEEFVFHLFLAYLHDKNKLDALFLSPDNLAEAVGFSICLLPRLFEVNDVKSLPPLTWILTNGDMMGAVSIGKNMAYMKEVTGIEKCPVCSDETSTPYHDPKIIGHPHAKFFFLSYGSQVSDPEFSPLKPFSLITVSNEGNITEQPLIK